MICIAKQLANKLNDIKILELGKSYEIIKTKQFYIMEWEGKWSINGSDQEDFKHTEDFAISALAEAIKSFSNVVRFNYLNIPRAGIEELGTNLYGNVWVRMICDYIPMSDMLINRYDVLIEKVNSNV